MKAKPLTDRLLLAAFLIVLVVFGVLVARKYLNRVPTAPIPAPVALEPRHLREIILYFGDPEGSLLTAEAREIEDCLEEVDCIRETVRALVNGPIGDLIPILPSNTAIRGVRTEEGTAVIDFSADLVAGHPGGSISELLTVYGLADTLAVNFPHLRQVRILVEGKAPETLKGHVDLREPIPADFSFVRPAETDGTSEPDPLLLDALPTEPLEKSQQ